MDNLEKKQLQWIKGDKIGTVETVNSIDGEWTIFKSGARIATSLIDEFLMPINKEPLNFEETVSRSVAKSIKSNKEKVKEKLKEPSPIGILFNKQKNYDSVNLNLDFLIDVPKKPLYDIISTSFELDEVNEELESFIRDQISEDLIKNILFESIKEFVKTRYQTHQNNDGTDSNRFINSLLQENND